MSRTKLLWISVFLAGLVVFLEVLGGVFKLDLMIPEFAGQQQQQRRTKTVLVSREPGMNSSTTAGSNATTNSSNNNSSNRKTCGYSNVNDATAREKKRLVDRLNQRAMDILDEQQQQQKDIIVANTRGGNTTTHEARSILYFDWGGAVRVRSFGVARIPGDSINHYGLPARLVALQMLTNVLVTAAAQQSRTAK